MATATKPVAATKPAKPASKGKAKGKPAAAVKPVPAPKVEAPKPVADFTHLKAIAAEAKKSTTLSTLNAALEAAIGGKGYDQAVALGNATGITWDDWAQLTSQQAAAGTVNDGEQALRDLEMAASPEYATDTRLLFAKRLQLAVNASDHRIAAKARANMGKVPARDDTLDSGGMLKAKEELKRDHNAAPDFLAAIDDATKLALLGKEKHRLTQAGSRLRSRLFMGLLDPVIKVAVPKSQHSRLGILYPDLAVKANSVQKDLISKSGPTTGAILKDRVQAQLNGKVTDKLDKEEEALEEYEAKEISELDDAKAKEAARAVYRALGSMYKLEVLNWAQYTGAIVPLEQAGFTLSALSTNPKKPLELEAQRANDTTKRARSKPVAAPKDETAPVVTTETIGDAA